MNEIISIDSLLFACPKCQQTIQSTETSLYCKKCNRYYPVINSIPDFIIGESKSTLSQVLSIARFMDYVSPIYESRYWWQLNLKLAGAKNTSMQSLVNFHSKTLEGKKGFVLDVACGPATFGRRIVSQSRIVYGIDISMGILKKGEKYIQRECKSNIYLARARVEELPFKNAVFDAAICSGSLHLFPDTVLALREIARTLKKGAPLSVQTFIAGNTIVNRALKKRPWVHNFGFSELQQCFADSGFEGFESKLDGPIVITFSVRKS